ncbi:flagellar protein FlaG [Rheinheimera sp.]|uniref:flagellar protein FlaG n=1 Tax=Rheinheimera sp. TaxID=1869214 RepID=UPI00307D42B0
MINIGTNIAGVVGNNAALKLDGVSVPKAEAAAVNQVADAPLETLADAEKTTALKPADKAEELTALYDAVDMVNQKLMVKSTNLVFEFDDAKDPPIVKVVDKANGEVIREIPSKELREIAKALNSIADNLNSSSGVLLNEHW